MKVIVGGGTGFIGQYLVNRWLTNHAEVIVIGRSEETIHQVFGTKVKAITWQNFAIDGEDLLHDADLIINLTGANIGAKRWTEKRKAEIIESRIMSTKLISTLCAKLGDKSPPWFNASAVGIYGLQKIGAKKATKPFNEYAPINFDKAPDFLAKVARKWELKTNPAKAHGVRVINLRFGVVLGPNGGVLEKLVLPFKLFMGGPIGTGKQPFPWIHIEDVWEAILFLMNHTEISGPVNLVAPDNITEQQLASALGKALNRPSCMPTPAFTMKLAFGEMANELLLNGTSAVPSVLLDSGFQFKHATIDNALSDIYL